MSEVAVDTASVGASLRGGDSLIAETISRSSRPKSKKELRAEKKAARKAAAAAASKPRSAEEIKAEKLRLKKEQRKQKLKEREREAIREMRQQKKVRQQKRKRRELHAVGGGLDPRQAAERLKERREKKKQKWSAAQTSLESKERDRAVFDKVFNGAGADDEEAGARTLELGVKAIDIVIGKGPEIVQNRSLVTVKYKLTGGKYGAVIDSSNKFTFRVGMGEVIRGWDIGVKGMAVGGTRKLIVPPKAGYGGEDIGAGPGAMLFFHITVLSCS